MWWWHDRVHWNGMVLVVRQLDSATEWLRKTVQYSVHSTWNGIQRLLGYPENKEKNITLILFVQSRVAGMGCIEIRTGEGEEEGGWTENIIEAFGEMKETSSCHIWVQ